MAKGISTYYGQQYLTPVEPNILLNSDMYRWQRGVSLVVDNDYTCDRFATRAVNQLLASSSSVQVIEDSIIPSGIGARKSAVINANQIATSLGFGQRIESTELDSYRGKLLQFSIYIQRMASLPGSNIQLAYSQAASPDSYTGNYLNDMPNLVYDSSFDGLTTVDFDRVSGSILITDAMADNGIQIGLKIVNVGEVTAELTGNLCRVTGFMLNQSDVLTPWKKASTNQAIEDTTLQRYYEKSYDLDVAPGTAPVFTGMREQHTNHSQYIALPGAEFRITKRVPASITTYSPDNGTAGTVTLYAGAANHGSGVTVGRSGVSGFTRIAGISVSLVVGAPYRYQWTADAEIR